MATTARDWARTPRGAPRQALAPLPRSRALVPVRRRRLDIRPMDVIVGVELFILAIVYSRTYSFFPELRSPLNWIAILIPLAFVVPALSLRPYAAFVTLVTVVVLIAYQLWFSLRWGTPFTGAAVGGYQGLVLAAMIALYLRGGNPSRFLTVFFVATLCYLVVYLYFYWTIDIDQVIQAQMSGKADYAASIRRTHDSRQSLIVESEFKVGTSGAIMAFVMLYALAFWRSARDRAEKWAASALVLVALYAVWVSDSRFNSIAVVAAAFAMFVPITARQRALAAFGVAAAGAAVILVCALLSLNVFSALDWDFSGAARADEFRIANPVLLSNILFGIGLKNSADDFTAAFRADVFVGDLGWYGDLIQFGVFGVAIILFCYWLMASFVVGLSRGKADLLTLRVLSAYLVYLAIVQILTPQLTGGAGAILLSLTFAYAGVRSLKGRPPRRIPERRSMEASGGPRHRAVSA